MLSVMVKQANQWSKIYTSTWLSDCEKYALEKIAYDNPIKSIQRVEIHDHEGPVRTIYDASWH